MPWTTPITFVAGAILTAAQQNVIQENLKVGGPTYTNEAARDAAITAPAEGMRAYLTDPTSPAGAGKQTVYSGAAWVAPQVLSLPPFALASLVTNQSIANSTDTYLQLSASSAATAQDAAITAGALTTTIANAGRITINTTGIYVVTVNLQWGANATGYRTVAVVKNLTGSLTGGAVLISTVVTNAGIVTTHGFSAPLSLAATDTLVVGVNQNSGGSLPCATAAPGGNIFSAVLLGKIA